jgi:antitoxin HicB
MSTTLMYSVVLDPQEEGGFTVTVPALPEVVTQGETEAEALTMVQEAIELALEVRKERGEEIPTPGKALLRQVAVPVAA